ncbi:hypothetical protein E0H39_22955 [Rhizobium leguminosarum bv. viciae]|nr:hypothetical protein [Rhizobium leguminosarum bv. viciae]OOO47411.1 hypothetical protein BS629_17540 [Rhizobium leguminosarum bv. viciae USDA 2370]RWX35353.1 hypothetical protein EHH54_23215 [Rhizobium leguminosarum]NKK15538.1 hypothetical protein [Rhizobium leguminosarum bv. viciae]NKK30656.1 hypothetical protein [Rhizobium leguminosarum bv. viciae]
MCVQTDARRSKAGRDLSDSLLALSVFVLAHVVIAKPLHTFARHALIPLIWGGLSEGISDPARLNHSAFHELENAGGQNVRYHSGT